MLKRSLPMQVLLAVAIGVALGLVFPGNQLGFASEIGKAIIHWVKIIAGPFLFLTVVASVIEVNIRWRDGGRLVRVALINTGFAIAIGVLLAKYFLSDLQLPVVPKSASAGEPFALSFSAWLKTMMPGSVFQPFVQNDILVISLLALLTALALRQIYHSAGETKLQEIGAGFTRVREVPAKILEWLLKLIPLAVAGVVAGSVSQYGVEPLVSLLRYVVVVLLGFAIQVCAVYGVWLFVVARVNVRRFIKEAKAPVFYALGVNSSLATLPLTFTALKNLGVSSRSASLGAGVATNINNDGIVLYEAMAVFFIAGIYHMPMSMPQMIIAALACIVAAMGITGIPEAGFISLTVVVATLGLPAEALPLLLAVDWMIARWRSVVNVLSDMTLSIVMDMDSPKDRWQT